MKSLPDLARLARHPIYRRALRHRVAGGIEHAPVLRGRALATIVDVGANGGQFSLVSRQVHPRARIHAFEPLPAAADRFRAVFAGDAATTLHPVALGRATATSTIHVAASDDSSSLLPISARQTEIFPGTGEVGAAEVEVRRLDEVVDADDLVAPALLKIDVQGYELEVLAGVGDLLDRFASVYVECSFQELYEGQALADEVVRELHARGFALTGAYHLATDDEGRAVQADLWFDRI